MSTVLGGDFISENTTLTGTRVRANALAAFQRRTKIDMGGFRVSFNPQRRSSTYVTQSMMTLDGILIG